MRPNNFDQVSRGQGNPAVSFPRYGERTWTGYQAQLQAVQWSQFGHDPSRKRDSYTMQKYVVFLSIM